MKKGTKHTPEAREKIRQNNLLNPRRYWLGKKRILSEEHKRKLSEAGKKTDISPMLATIKKGKEHKNWKGEKATYRSKHNWIEREKGIPTECINCKKPQEKDRRKGVVWANINHKYKRNLNDWIALCNKCHGEHDKKNNLRKHIK